MCLQAIYSGLLLRQTLYNMLSGLQNYTALPRIENYTTLPQIIQICLDSKIMYPRLKLGNYRAVAAFKTVLQTYMSAWILYWFIISNFHIICAWLSGLTESHLLTYMALFLSFLNSDLQSLLFRSFPGISHSVYNGISIYG